MDQMPRPPEEPIINRSMRVGIIVQTISITSVTLGAYLIGLNMENVAHGEFNVTATTMAFATLTFSELVRAFTARSERYSILKIGVFSNRNMNIAVLFSFILALAVIYVPSLNEVFDTVPLTLLHWEIITPLLIIPSIAAEVTKAVLIKRELSLKTEVS